MNPTPTPLPPVDLHMGAVITTTKALAADQLAAWNIDSSLAPLLLSLLMFVFVCWLIMLVKCEFLPWPADTAESDG